MTRLSRADLEAVLDFAGEVRTAARESERADPMLLERIASLLDSEGAAYSQFDAFQQLGQDAEFPGPGHMPSDTEWEMFRSENPYTAYAERARDPYFSARRVTDVVDMREFRRSPLYELVRGDDLHSAQMRMPGESGTTWVFEVVRAGTNFGRRDLLLLDRLRPWLIHYEEHHGLRQMVAKIAASSTSAFAAAALSARENEVLDLVAEGASNARIAERLWISPNTVRKHLENIYLKLEVSSRTAALARTGRASVASPSVPG